MFDISSPKPTNPMSENETALHQDLHVAVWLAKVDEVEAVLSHPINALLNLVDRPNSFGHTALLIAVSRYPLAPHRFVEVIRILLNYGADPKFVRKRNAELSANEPGSSAKRGLPRSAFDDANRTRNTNTGQSPKRKSLIERVTPW